MNNRILVRCVSAIALGTASLLAACTEEPLDVTNPNQPDITLAYGNANNVEAVIGKLFQQMFNGQYGASDDVWTQTLVLSFEGSSQLGNFGMGTRSIIPRPLIDNSIGNTVAVGNFRDYDHLTRNLRGATNAIAASNAFGVASFGSAARLARAKSFAFFALGYGLGHLSLLYDSAAIISPATPQSEVPPFSPATAVNAAALAALDSALALANSADATTGSGGWPIPKEWWLSSGTAGAGPDRATWIRIIRSFQAKFRAGVARTVAERAAVDWTAVISDATNGIVADLTIQSDVQAGWSTAVIQQMAVSASWDQMTPFILGMADTAGIYDAWLQQPVLTRAWGTTPLRTPDQRFPSGQTRAAQNTASGGTSRDGPPAGTILYFRNRPAGEDASNYPWGQWQYDNHRFWLIRAAGGNGTWMLMSRAEGDLLAAEGYLRAGNVASAIPLIDRYRTRAGLPALAGVVTTLTDPVPGAGACVPRVPVPAAIPPMTVCGTIFEAMKWEKRLETSFTGHSQWYIDSRGWGDLYAGTPLEWPVPYQELFARNR
ncbi:MAG: hypothetical protein H7Y20_04900, partial [Bryobacteraceae bacterium]|nr:hypothetical protein [Bryobacteraceae bacterium]